MQFVRPVLSTALSVVAVFVVPALPAQDAIRSQAADLAGTSWQLVGFRGGDGSERTPEDRSRYTIAFQADGRVNVRVDCNRGSATWRSRGRNQLEFGPLALTRAMCPPQSLHDLVVRQWPYVRSYVVRNEHLFLSLLADGGIFEFEPLGGQSTGTGQIQGSATYRERIALPANAVFEVSLEDVSRAGGAAEVIARVRNEQPGNVPIPFLIAYDEGRIDRTHRYAVRARILVNNRVWFTTDANYPVLAGGTAGNVVQLVLRRSNAPTASGGFRSRSAVPLENTYWKLIRLGNDTVTATERQPEPHVILHPAKRRVTGSGGCNRLGGSYTLNGDNLSFEQVISTMMACIEGMETEQKFHAALENTRRWKVTGQQLDLLDSGNTVIARFEAVSLR